jgi:hypothetical protein
MSTEKIKNVLEQIKNRISSLKGRGEEATKQAMILPLLDALGYDIWNPSEVCPEYEADFAIKKSGQKEKVDLAILVGGIPRIFIEVKSIDTNLDGHEGQLSRYFNAVPMVKLGVLTNGLEWRFFTDIQDVNIMDNQPFIQTSIEALDATDTLVKFSKNTFTAESIRDYATENIYTEKIAKFLKSEFDLRDKDPSEYLIRWVLKSESMYEGVVNSNVVDRFRGLIKKAYSQVLRDIVKRSIASIDNAVIHETHSSISEKLSAPIVEDKSKTRIFTSDNELKCYEVLRALFESSLYSTKTIYDATLKKDVALELGYKDTTSYFGVYINKPNNWIARIAIDTKSTWIAFNLNEPRFSELLPSSFTRLEASSLGECRCAISNPDDLNGLTRIFYASLDQLIEDKKNNN